MTTQEIRITRIWWVAQWLLQTSIMISTNQRHTEETYTQSELEKEPLANFASPLQHEH